MTTAWQVVSHTPPWVWGLLAVLLWLGWRDLGARTTSPCRLAILPAVALVTSLLGAATATMPALSLPVWLAGLSAGLPAGLLIAQRRQLALAPGRALRLSGGWFSLVLGLSIFTIRYAMGVAVARQPALAGDPQWIVAAHVVGGIVAGIGLGWATGLVTRYRRLVRAASGRGDALNTAT